MCENLLVNKKEGANMENFKKCCVWLIPTNEETNIILDRNNLEYINNAQIASTINSCVTGYNIYITSNDDIKVDDYYITIFNKNNILKHSKNNILPKWSSKIIATTDITMNSKFTIVVSNGEFKCKVNNNALPKIPKTFINYFISQYNTKKIIEKAYVEYNSVYSTSGSTKKELEDNLTKKDILKINIDNSINIKLYNIKTHNLKSHLLNMINFCKIEINSNYGFTQRTTEELDLLYKTSREYKNKLKELYDSEYYKGQLDLIEFMKDRFTEDAPLSYILSELKKEI